MKKLLTLLLLCCSLNLSAQGLSRQEFYNGLPVRVWDNETYFLNAVVGGRDCMFIPLFMPTSVKNLTVYKWNTRSEFGRDVPTSVREIWDVTYKDGKLRTKQMRGENEICQYEFDGKLCKETKVYEVSSGRHLATYSDTYRDKVDYVCVSRDEVYVVPRRRTYETFFDTSDGKCDGYYYLISNNETYNKITFIRWKCSNWYFIKNHGGISSLNKLKKEGFKAVNDVYVRGSLYSIVEDKEMSRSDCGSIYINAIGLPTDKDAFECLSDGWLYRGEGKVEKYWYTYEYE